VLVPCGEEDDGEEEEGVDVLLFAIWQSVQGLCDAVFWHCSQRRSVGGKMSWRCSSILTEGEKGKRKQTEQSRNAIATPVAG
jgi:hypothetical protein